MRFKQAVGKPSKRRPSLARRQFDRRSRKNSCLRASPQPSKWAVLPIRGQPITSIQAGQRSRHVCGTVVCLIVSPCLLPLDVARSRLDRKPRTLTEHRIISTTCHKIICAEPDTGVQRRFIRRHSPGARFLEEDRPRPGCCGRCRCVRFCLRRRYAPETRFNHFVHPTDVKASERSSVSKVGCMLPSRSGPLNRNAIVWASFNCSSQYRFTLP